MALAFSQKDEIRKIKLSYGVLGWNLDTTAQIIEVLQSILYVFIKSVCLTVCRINTKCKDIQCHKIKKICLTFSSVKVSINLYSSASKNVFSSTNCCKIVFWKFIMKQTKCFFAVSQ